MKSSHALGEKAGQDEKLKKQALKGDSDPNSVSDTQEVGKLCHVTLPNSSLYLSHLREGTHRN